MTKSTAEFARSHSNIKFHDVHRMLLHEGKAITDHFYGSSFFKKRAKRNAFQIVGTEDKVNKFELVDNGLYVATKLGSLCLPSSGLDMRKARTLLERLFSIKSMGQKQNNNRSPYDDKQVVGIKLDYYCTWARGS
ncbi:MAG: hypothetical protein EXX96DRAFT_540010 [Benjaminiella poitrasii]|nr:MAG: hypothetical protein EXX96DRAFT_540010 [Benjaminiella poitrasii]